MLEVCHSAYQIEAQLRRRLPQVQVFQEYSTDDMRVIGTKGNPATYQGLADAVLPSDRLDEVLEAADLLVLCQPLCL